MNAITDHKTSFINPDSLLDVSRLRAIAELAKTRGDVRFMLGGGVLFDTPMTKAERLALPAPQVADVEYLDLPQDRFARARTQDPTFDAFVKAFTVPHAREGYRLVVIPLAGRLSAAKLTAIADAAETLGHGAVRITPDVSIRLPNVPNALLRPLFGSLRSAELIDAKPARLAA